jgi:hypothetical protein
MIAPWQATKVRASLQPNLNYLNRLQTRMDRATKRSYSNLSVTLRTPCAWCMWNCTTLRVMEACIGSARISKPDTSFQKLTAVNMKLVGDWPRRDSSRHHRLTLR